MRKINKFIQHFQYSLRYFISVSYIYLIFNWLLRAFVLGAKKSVNQFFVAWAWMIPALRSCVSNYLVSVRILGESWELNFLKFMWISFPPTRHMQFVNQATLNVTNLPYVVAFPWLLSLYGILFKKKKIVMLYLLVGVSMGFKQVLPYLQFFRLALSQLLVPGQLYLVQQIPRDTMILINVSLQFKEWGWLTFQN